MTLLSHPSATSGDAERRAVELGMVSSDPSELRQAFGRFPSGIAALCAAVDGEPVGMISSSFSVGVSFDPPLVLFSVQNSSTTWPKLRTSPRIGVSILGIDHAETAGQLASRTRDRFAGLDIATTPEGAVLIGGSSLWMECEIMSENPAGDHHIVVLKVTGIKVEHGMEPLVYHAAEFRQLAVAS